MFISNFKQSTCSYSDAENMVRLQNCLRGRALETVQGRLLSPASVPHVISTLRIVYGRPELIIRALMQKNPQSRGTSTGQTGNANPLRPSSGKSRRSHEGGRPHEPSDEPSHDARADKEVARLDEDGLGSLQKPSPGRYA